MSNYQAVWLQYGGRGDLIGQSARRLHLRHRSLLRDQGPREQRVRRLVLPRPRRLAHARRMASALLRRLLLHYRTVLYQAPPVGIWLDARPQRT